MRHRIVSLVLTSSIIAACSEQSSPPTSPRPGAAEAARAPSVPTPNVTSTVYDADASGNLLLTRSDAYNGAGYATYTSGNKINSYITANGAWQLYLGSQTTRTLYLVLASQGIPAPDGHYSASVEAYSQCFDQSDSQVSILRMAAGESNGNCSFGMDFSYGSTKYKLVMSPKFAGTGRASITCDMAAGGYCSRWTIVLNAVAANAGVANLYHYSPRGSLLFDGVYHNSFSITAAE